MRLRGAPSSGLAWLPKHSVIGLPRSRHGGHAYGPCAFRLLWRVRSYPLIQSQPHRLPTPNRHVPAAGLIGALPLCRIYHDGSFPAGYPRRVQRRGHEGGHRLERKAPARCALPPRPQRLDQSAPWTTMASPALARMELLSCESFGLKVAPHGLVRCSGFLAGQTMQSSA